MSTPGFTYNYNASALGLGGVLQHSNGATTIIPSLASVALAPTGGEGFNEILNYDKDGVSFSNARSSVFGYDSAYRTFTTISEIYITNLDLFGRVKAALLHTRIESTREVLTNGDIAKESDPDKARFSMQATILGLRIDDVDVIPQFDIDLCECATYEQFTAKIRGRGIGTSAQQFGIEENELQTVLEAKVQPIRASFVRNLQHEATAMLGPRKGFKLPVKKFGNVHFGELVVKPGRRRVNLLRLEFDSMLAFQESEAPAGGTTLADGDTSFTSGSSSSPFKGSATILSLDGNGAPSWP